MATITTQPLLAPPPSKQQLYTDGKVTIRNLTDTPEDARFSGTCMVQAFRSKFVHATSESKIPQMEQMMTNHCRGRPAEFYEREFIAEYEGVMAGSCVLRYQGDHEKFPDRNSDVPSGLGCCDGIGLLAFDSITEHDVKPKFCYVDHICVDAQFRGKGIGKVLLEMADVDAKKKGCTVIYLWVAADNPAQHLYTRQGYKITDTKSGCCVKCMIGIDKFNRMDKYLI